MTRSLRFALALSALAGPVGAEVARPVALLDSATLRVQVSDGSVRVVRAIGLIAPRDASCTLSALGDFMQAINGELTVASDPNVAAEKNTVLYRYLHRGSVDVGAEAIRRGLALSADGPYERAAAYRGVENDARKAQRGLWSIDCAAALTQTMADRAERSVLPPPVLPRGNAAAAKEAIAVLQRRNEAGDNRAEDAPVNEASTARSDQTEQRSPASQESSEKQADAAPEKRPGRASQLSGPYIRKLGQGRVRVEGKFWNAGETPIRGRVGIELRENGSLVDSASVSMTLEPDGKQSYSVDLAPGDDVSNLTATAKWEGG